MINNNHDNNKTYIDNNNNNKNNKNNTNNKKNKNKPMHKLIRTTWSG